MKYQKPSPIAMLEEEFPCGILVSNLGYRARVIGYHVAGQLLILEHNEIGKWLADPQKCSIPAQRPQRPMIPMLI